MARSAFLALFLGAALIVSGCRGKEKEEAPRGTASLMEEVAKAEYRPPADGRLTERQVEMYVKVEARSRKIRGNDPATADLRAARELGVNPKELLWVQDRVREAESAGAGAILDSKIQESRLRVLRFLEEERKKAVDPGRRAEIDRQIGELRALMKGSRPSLGPGVRHNAALIAKHRDDLERARGGKEG